MNTKTMGTAALALATAAATLTASAKLVNYYEFDSAENLLKAEAGYGEDGKAYDSSKGGVAPVAKDGNYTLQAVTTNGANAVYLPMGASFGFDHGTDGKDWCIEMRILIPTNTPCAALFQNRQDNTEDGYVFYGGDAQSIGGGTSYLGEDNPPTPCTPEAWHKVVIAFLKGMPMLYVDGVPQRYTDRFTGYLKNMPKLFMGADDNAEDNPYYLDYVKVYDETMPAELGYDLINISDCVWTGDAGEDENWSTAANWHKGVIADSTKTAFFSPDVRIRLDGDKTVQDFAAWSVGTTFIYNDGPTKTTLKATDLYRTGYTGATLEFNGNVAANITGGKCYNYASKLIASDGATFTATKLNYGSNPDQHLIATGEGSLISLGSITFTGTANKNTGEALEAYDGGTIKLTTTTTAMKPMAPFTVIATNSSTISAGKLDLSTAYTHKLTCEDSYVYISAFSGSAGGTTLKVGGVGEVDTAGKFSFAGNGANALNLWLYGSLPEIYAKGNSETVIGTGNTTYKGKVSLNLAPEPTWKEGWGRINKKAGDKAKFTLSKYVNFKVDCTGFANYYGKRRMALLNQETTSGTALATQTFNAPTSTYLSKSGTGKDKCDITFDSTTTTFYMTITSTNAEIPATAVAGVNNAGKATVFYDTVAAAVAAAREADTDEAEIVLVKDATAGKLQNPDPGEGKTKNIKIYALDSVTLTTLGKLGEGITVGENVTLKEKAGMMMYLR